MDSAEERKFFAQKYLLLKIICETEQIFFAMTLFQYFKRRDCLPDPRGSLSEAITPQVIASVNSLEKLQALVGEQTLNKCVGSTRIRIYPCIIYGLGITKIFYNIVYTVILSVLSLLAYYIAT